TRAAREAAATSPGSAADLFGRAVDLMGPTDPERDRLRTEQARSLIWAGRIADAEAVCRTVLDRTPDPELAGDARICLGHALLVGGRPRLALAELAQAVEASELADPERDRGLAW